MNVIEDTDDDIYTGEEEAGADSADELANDTDRGDELFPNADAKVLDVVLGDADGQGEAQESGSGQEDGEDEMPKPGNHRVPISRLNEVIEQRQREKLRADALEAELERLRKQPAHHGEQEGGAESNQGSGNFDFEAKEQEYNDALLDGDPQTASRIRAEIRGAERQQIQHEIEQQFRQREADAAMRKEQQALDVAVSKIKATHPFLNPDSDMADREAIADTEALFDRYFKEGMGQTEALNLAVSKVLKMRGEVPEIPAQGKSQTDSRKAAALARNIQAANAQPPQLRAGVGERGSEALDISKMGVDDIDKLSEEERRRERGDLV